MRRPPTESYLNSSKRLTTYNPHYVLRPRSRPPGPAWRAGRKRPPLLAAVLSSTLGCAAVRGGQPPVLWVKVNGQREVGQRPLLKGLMPARRNLATPGRALR